MAQRMNRDEEMYRIYVEFEYVIRYRSFNKEWDYKEKTSGDLDGDNPMYVQHPDDTHEHYAYYLGPYASVKMAETQYKKFRKNYEESPESYRNFKMSRGPVERAYWKPVT